MNVICDLVIFSIKKDFFSFGRFCRPYYLQPVGKRGRPSRQRLGSGHKRNRYKKVAAPVAALHCATLPHCPTVNNALGSLVSGGVVAAREARSAILAKTLWVWNKKSFVQEIFGDFKIPGGLRESRYCLGFFVFDGCWSVVPPFPAKI